MIGKTQILILSALLTGLIIKPASAYIGPGIAIALLGYVSWPIAVLVGILSIFVFYPLRYVYRKLVKKQPPETPESKNQTDGKHP